MFGGIRASTLWTAVSKTWPCESCWVRTRCWGPAGRGRSPAWPGLQRPCLGSEEPASSLWGPASPDSSHPAHSDSRLDQFSAEALLNFFLNLQWWGPAWSSHTPSSSCDRLWPAAPPETPSSARSHSPETASLKSRQHKPGKNLCVQIKVRLTRRMNLPALWKKPVNVSCRLEAKLWKTNRKKKLLFAPLLR